MPRFPASSLILAALFAALAAAACRAPIKSGPAKAHSREAEAEAATSQPVAGSDMAAFGQRIPADLFNPNVTAEQRLHPRPKRGGEITVRLAGDCQSLLPLLDRWKQERDVLLYITETLAALDGETYENLPKAAAYFKTRDLVERRGGRRIEGLITSESARSITIAPGASAWTLLKSDIVSTDSATGAVKTRFGQTLRGELKSFVYSVQLRETPASAPLTLAVSDLTTWTNEIGGRVEVRPFVKKQCVYEFRLREGIRWHDGAPATMRDAKTWFDTMRNDSVDAADYRFLYLDVEEMKLLDDMTAKFTYRKPYYKSLEVCGGVSFLPTHLLRPERFAGDPEGYAKFYNTHPMGTPGRNKFVGIGPYKLDRWTAGQEIVLVRDNNYWAKSGELNYWDKDRPYLDKITYRIVVEKTPALREMENGQIDADFEIEPDTWVLPRTTSAAFQSRFVRANPSVSSYTYIGWNMDRVLFKDARVRRALTMLLPLQDILDEIHYGLGKLSLGPNDPPDPWAAAGKVPLPYDPAMARRLLREAGWIDHDGDGIRDKDGQPFEFEYLFHTARDYHAKIADIVKQYLGQAGIQVNLRKLDVTVLHEQIVTHKFDAVRMAWGGTVDPDPYQIWHSSQNKRGGNYVNYNNPKVDQLIERLREEFDRDKRWAMMREVDRIIYEDQPYTFMYVFDQLSFYSRKFRGVKFYRYSPTEDLTEWYVAQ
jgi:peptide/nickel transport system substrate-binding protein